MNWKMGLKFLLVASGGVALGAWGMTHFGSWEGVAQALGVLRQRGDAIPAATRAALNQPTDQAKQDAHTGHVHNEHTPEQGAAQPRQANAKGRPAAKADTHRHGAGEGHEE